MYSEISRIYSWVTLINVAGHDFHNFMGYFDKRMGIGENVLTGSRASEEAGEFREAVHQLNMVGGFSYHGTGH